MGTWGWRRLWESDRAFLAAVLAGGAAVRLWRLDSQSLWLDELFSVAVSELSVEGVAKKMAEEFHPPLYYWLLKAWRLLGTSDLHVRALSVLLGCLTIPLFFSLSGKVLGRNARRLATCLLAFSPLHVYFSQEVRGYVLTHLLAVASLDLYVGARGRPSGARFAGLLLLDVAGLYTHVFYGLHLLVRPLLLPWLRAPGERRSALVATLLGAALAGAAYVPWWSGVSHVAGLEEGYRMPVGPMNIGYVLYTWSVGIGWGPGHEELRGYPDPLEVLGNHPLSIGSAAVLFGGLLLLGIRAIGRGGEGRRRAALLLQFTVPIAGAFVVAHFIVVSLLPRYPIVGFPAFLLLIAAGLLSLPGRLRAAAGLAVFALWGGSLWNAQTNPRFMREDYRGVGALLAESRGDGDRVLLPSFCIPFVTHYLEGKSETGGRESLEPLTESAVREAREAERTWVVLNQVWTADPDGRIRRALAERRDVSEEWELIGFKVYLIGSPSAKPLPASRRRRVLR
ncbi:MAG: glycosyltransferase family 39 protein [Planctomycetota bacterium]